MFGLWGINLIIWLGYYFIFLIPFLADEDDNDNQNLSLRNINIESQVSEQKLEPNTKNDV